MFQPLEELRRAIAALWGELPRLLGADWPRFERQLRFYLAQLAVTQDLSQRRNLYDQIRLLFFDHAAADARLLELLEAHAAPESLSLSLSLRSTSADEEAALESLPSPRAAATVTRYTDILAPAQVRVEQRFAVIAGLTCQPTSADESSQSMTVQVGDTVQVVLTVAQPATVLEIVGERMKPLTVQAERDSDPAVFYLLAHAPGHHTVQIDYWYGGQIVATHQRTISAADQPSDESVTSSPTLAVTLAPALAPHPDLIVRVTTLERQLRFDLHFADTRFLTIVGPTLRADPEAFRADLLQEIEALRNDAGDDPDYVLAELTKIGQRLYRDLFPIELRREYRRFRHTVRTMQIVSDEPWIPWELVKPYDGEDPSDPVDDDFFCVQYLFARWFTPAAPPAQQIVIRNLAAITPADCDLASAHTEQAMVRGLAARYALNDRTPAATTRRAVEALLGGAEPVELWHFACHGSFRSDAPNRSAIQLENNAELRPDDLVGPVETRLRSDRPIFFLNACRVGSVGLSLTGLGGWAKVLVQDCGVGALVAPLWEVNDQLAQMFSTTFYEALAVPGATIAEAARQARHALKMQAPQDPIWLAYSLFAHPNAQITLGAGPGV